MRGYEKIKWLRNGLNLSGEEFAFAIGRQSRSTVSRYEIGMIITPIGVLRAMVALGKKHGIKVTVEELIK